MEHEAKQLVSKLYTVCGLKSSRKQVVVINCSANLYIAKKIKNEAHFAIGFGKCNT